MLLSWKWSCCLLSEMWLGTLDYWQRAREEMDGKTQSKFELYGIVWQHEEMRASLSLSRKETAWGIGWDVSVSKEHISRQSTEAKSELVPWLYVYTRIWILSQKYDTKTKRVRLIATNWKVNGEFWLQYSWPTPPDCQLSSIRSRFVCGLTKRERKVWLPLQM